MTKLSTHTIEAEYSCLFPVASEGITSNFLLQVHEVLKLLNELLPATANEQDTQLA